MKAVEILDFSAYEQKQKKKRVCAYARVSTLKELQETSFNLQVQTYTLMIVNNPDWVFAGVYADQGKTGTSTRSRTQFNLMIELAKSNKIDLIITKSISRFARNVVDCLSAIQELRTYGTEVFFEKENISSFDSKIEFVISVLAGVAQEESRNLSENVKWNIQNRFKAGKLNMVTSLVLGYDNDSSGNIIINAKEAIIVKKIFSLYLKGYSQRKIASHLNSLGHKTKVGNIDYSLSAIYGILNNEKYTGNALLQKTARKAVGSKLGERNQDTLPKYYVKNSHPSIIKQELWDKVHLIKQKKIAKYNPKGKYKKVSKLNYTGFIKCGICNKNYHFKRNNINTIYESNLLICSTNRDKKVCVNDSIFSNTFDKVLLMQINYIIKNKDHFLNMLSKAFTTHAGVFSLKKKIKETQADVLALDKRLRLLISSDDEFDVSLKNSLIEQKTNLQVEISTCENLLLTTFNVDNVITRYKTLLKKFPKQIENLDSFPFKQLFNKVIIKSRNEVEFVISFGDLNTKLLACIFNEKETKYTIRKTKYFIKSMISIY